MSVSSQFDFSRFDYQIDPKTLDITQTEKGKKKTDHTDQLIKSLMTCHKTVDIDTKEKKAIAPGSINRLCTFTKALSTFLEAKQLATVTPYKLRARPEQTATAKQIQTLQKIEADLVDISLKRQISELKDARDPAHIVALSKTLLGTPKTAAAATSFQEGEKALADTLLSLTELGPLADIDQSFSWLEAFVRLQPGNEKVTTLVTRLKGHEAFQPLIDTYEWLTRRYEGQEIPAAKILFLSYLIEVKMPSGQDQRYLKELLQTGLTECAEGASKFDWLKSFIQQNPNDALVNDAVSIFKTALEHRLISPKSASQLEATLQRFEEMSKDRKLAQVPARERLAMAFCSQVLAPKFKNQALQALLQESIERSFMANGDLQWIKRFIQEKPSEEQVKEVLTLLDTMQSLAAHQEQVKAGCEMLLKSYETLARESKAPAYQLLGLAYGIEIHLPKKDDAQSKELLQEGLGRLFAIEGNLRSLETILEQKPTKAQVQDLVTILTNLSKHDALGLKIQQEIQQLVSCYQALTTKERFSPLDTLKIAYWTQVQVRDDPLCFEGLMELIRVQGNLSSVEGILKQNLSESQARAIVSSFLNVQEPVELRKIAERYQQLAQVKPEELGLNPNEMLRMAYFIEVKLAKVVQATGPYVKKDQAETSLLARSLLVNVDTGELYILSKRKVQILDASGTYMRVTSSVALPRIGNAILVAQAVGKHEKARTHPKDYEETVLMLKKQMQTHRELQKGPGIWPMMYWCEYTKALSESEKIPKITSIAAMAKGSLDSVKETITFDEIVQATSWLIKGLRYMHENGYIHCDLKLENALFTYVDGQLIAGWSDFGITVRVSADEKPQIAFEHGYYGTYPQTAPEVFNNPGFSADYAKAEMWALGYSLYQLYFKEDPPWAEKIAEYYSQEKSMDLEYYEQFKNLIADFINERISALPMPEERSREQHYEYLIYQLLLCDPAVRIDTKQAEFLLQPCLAT